MTSANVIEYVASFISFSAMMTINMRTAMPSVQILGVYQPRTLCMINIFCKSHIWFGYVDANC